MSLGNFSTSKQKEHDSLVQRIGGDVMPLELLTPVGKAIGEEVNWIGAAAATSTEDNENPLVGIGCEAIENLLGLAFVACQVFITNVVSLCSNISAFDQRKPPTKEGKKLRQTLLRTCSAQTRGAVTQLAAIDALANYFKHRDGWPSEDWLSTPNKGVRRTAEAIKQLGGNEHSRRNLRMGFETIVGDNGYSEVGRLAEVLENWAEGLRNDYSG